MRLYRWALIFGIAIEVALIKFSDVPIVGSSTISNKDGYHTEAGSHPALIACAILICSIYFFSMRPEPTGFGLALAGLWRRRAAVLIDFVSYLLIVAPITALVDLAMEARATGTFAWYFERSFYEPRDNVGFVAVFVLLALMLAYMAFPLTVKRQTIGQTIVGTFVETSSGLPLSRKEALVWAVRELYGLLKWGGGMNRSGRTDWDIKASVRVIRIGGKEQNPLSDLGSPASK